MATQKQKMNALARLFYKSMGYHVEEGYDFSVANHPTERMVWNFARTSHMFWGMAGLKEPKKGSKKPNLGIEVVADPNMPSGRAELRQDGKTVAVIENIKED